MLRVKCRDRQLQCHSPEGEFFCDRCKDSNGTDAYDSIVNRKGSLYLFVIGGQQLRSANVDQAKNTGCQELKTDTKNQDQKKDNKSTQERFFLSCVFCLVSQPATLRIVGLRLSEYGFVFQIQISENENTKNI